MCSQPVEFCGSRASGGHGSMRNWRDRRRRSRRRDTVRRRRDRAPRSVPRSRRPGPRRPGAGYSRFPAGARIGLADDAPIDLDDVVVADLLGGVDHGGEPSASFVQRSVRQCGPMSHGTRLGEDGMHGGEIVRAGAAQHEARRGQCRHVSPKLLPFAPCQRQSRPPEQAGETPWPSVTTISCR